MFPSRWRYLGHVVLPGIYLAHRHTLKSEERLLWGSVDVKL